MKRQLWVFPMIACACTSQALLLLVVGRSSGPALVIGVWLLTAFAGYSYARLTSEGTP